MSTPPEEMGAIRLLEGGGGDPEQGMGYLDVGWHCPGLLGRLSALSVLHIKASFYLWCFSVVAMGTSRLFSAVPTRAGEEEAGQMARHDPMMVLKGTTFVQYSHAISNQMEDAYQAFKGQGMFPKDV